MDSHIGRARTFLAKVQTWANERDDVRALLLVGSFARGEARTDSDLGVLLLTSSQRAYLDDTTWVSVFGQVDRIEVEPYGRVTSVRAFYPDGLEVEFGVAPADWATRPLDPGTEAVVRGGIVVLLDRDGDAEELAGPHGVRPS
jgi:predicted nucleotidyltransferase